MPECLQLEGIPQRYSVERWTAGEYRELLPVPAPDDDKYSRGMLLVMAGSSRFPGSAVLCARAASRGGCGYVELCVPEPIVTVAQGHLASVPVISCASDGGAFAVPAERAVLEGRTPNAVVFGPGVTICENTEVLSEHLLRTAAMPLLFDADALTMLSSRRQAARERCDAGLGLVLTPHGGEMARLSRGLGGIVAQGIYSKLPEDWRTATLEQRVAGALSVSAGYGATVVFKGRQTIVASGSRAVVCDEGVPSLATAGTGDVLSGLVGALLAHGLPALEAACLGVHLHSLAGRAAADEHGVACVIAEDVIDAIGIAYKETAA